jgi:hypothetical protein
MHEDESIMTIAGRRARWRGLGWACTVGSLLLLTGCSSKGNVSGKVTINGTPLNTGTVGFYAGGQVYQGNIGNDGTYTIKCPPGEVRIAIFVPKATMGPSGGMPAGAGSMPKDVKAPPGVDMGKFSGGAGVAGGPVVEIPDQYADPEKSGLTYTVTGGDQTHDIPLQ